MLLIFIIVIELVAGQEIVTELTSSCRCSQILSKQDCDRFCTWNSNKSVCLDKRCSDMTDLDSCAATTGCYFYNNECIIFRGCDTLGVDDECDAQGKCIVKDGACVNAVEEVVIQIICLDIKNQQDCDFKKETDSGKTCMWKSSETKEKGIGTCEGVTFGVCSDANVIGDRLKDLCDQKPISCMMWENDSGVLECTQKYCEDVTTQDECIANQWSIELLEDESLILCSWTGNQCIQGIDVSTIPQDECYKEETMYQLTYSDSTNNCTKCPGIGGILGIMNFIILFTIYFS